MVRPSGLQRGLSSAPGWSEILTGSPPDTGITHTSLLSSPSGSRPVRLDTNAIRVPSGAHCGSASFHRSPLVSCVALAEATSTIQMWLFRSSNQPVSLNLYASPV